MIRISSLKVPAGSDTAHLRKKAAHILGIRTEALLELEILKKSRDARKRSSVLDVYMIAVRVDNEKGVLARCRDKNVNLLEEKAYRLPKPSGKGSDIRPVVAGFGPAGIFASLILAHGGYRPLILERGKRIEEREEDVRRFFETGVLDISSNVQFGEGGAGTFSDGKLSTGIKDREGRKRFILDTFIRHGADRAILTDSHPHIGTDRLMSIIPSIRREIEELGGEVRFSTALTGLSISGEGLEGIMLSGEEALLPCTGLFLCLGHSARDTFRMLYDMGLMMEAKPFAVGVRAEHRREMIDAALHQDKASYRLAYHCRDGRGVYSFCMCPGGYVVNASSEEGYLTVNGMSLSARDGKNSNAAIVCTVGPGDYEGYGQDPLSGLRFQRELERRAFAECGGLVPYQRFADFKDDISSDSFGEVKPECRGRTGRGNIRNILPSYIADDIIEAMPEFGRKIKGFDGDDTLFAGIEARTSSPVRILRNEDMQSVNINGIYPVGEGAGYAGGIMSAAIDGMKAAEKYCKGNQEERHEGF